MANDDHTRQACRVVQDLLIKQTGEPLAVSETQQVDRHVAVCASCRAVQELVLRMHEAAGVPDAAALHPDPAIRDHLLQRFRDTRQWVSRPSTVWQSVTRILAFRIPVYQAVLAGVLVLALVLTLQHVSSPWGQTVVQRSASPRLDETVPPPVAVLDDPDIIARQKIGTTIQEDSMLTRFVMQSL